MFRGIVGPENGGASPLMTSGAGAPQENGLETAANDAEQTKTSKRSHKRLSAMMSKLQVGASHKDKLAPATNGLSQELGAVVRRNSAADGDGDDEADEFQEALGDSELLPGLDEVDLAAANTSSSKSSSPKQDSKEEEKCKDYLLPEEECDIPSFANTKNCDPSLIEQTRRLLRERYAKNPDSFYEQDLKRMLVDDWTVSRFLLRRRLDPKRTAKLMEECGRFRKQYKMSEMELWEFPIEFHKAGGLFKYARDRVGNVTVYMRVKMYRRVPEISDVFKAFILCVLELADVEAEGRGVAVIFDLSGCGLQNVDLGFLSWLLSSFRNYCPKGVSYILVYNLPWILNATCKLAMSWMSASNRRALRFVYGDEIENFIARENLPDYCGGTCKINYRQVPEGAKLATEVCGRLDMTREQALKIRHLFREYLDEDDLKETPKRKGSAKHKQLGDESGDVEADSNGGYESANGDDLNVVNDGDGAGSLPNGTTGKKSKAKKLKNKLFGK